MTQNARQCRAHCMRAQALHIKFSMRAVIIETGALTLRFLRFRCKDILLFDRPLRQTITYQGDALMRLKTLSCIAALALIGCTQTSVTTGYYDIQGVSAKTLDRQIRQKGPMKGHALASAEIKFEPLSILERQSEKGCDIKSAKIKVIANITLPRWRNRAGADPKLKRAFDNLARYAKMHEDIHVKIANAYARSMEKALIAIKPQKSCNLLEMKANRVIKTELDKHHKAQLAFDAAEQRFLRRLTKQAES